MFDDVCAFNILYVRFSMNTDDLSKLYMLISKVPLIRSRRAVSNGGLLLSVAYDLTCFTRFFERLKVSPKLVPKAGLPHLLNTTE